MCWGQEKKPISKNDSLVQETKAFAKKKEQIVPGENDFPGLDSLSQNVDVQVIANKVTVNLEENYLREVLDSIGKQSKIKFRFSNGIRPQKLSERFSLLPMNQALKRLLRNASYVIKLSRSEAGDRVTEVLILPRGTASLDDKRVLTQPNKSTMLRDVGRQIQGFKLEEMSNQLESASLPDDIRAQLRAITKKQVDLGKDITLNQDKVLTEMIQQLNSKGAVKPETTQQIRQHIQNITTKKPD